MPGRHIHSFIWPQYRIAITRKNKYKPQIGNDKKCLAMPRPIRRRHGISSCAITTWPMYCNTFQLCSIRQQLTEAITGTTKSFHSGSKLYYLTDVWQIGNERLSLCCSQWNVGQRVVSTQFWHTIAGKISCVLTVSTNADLPSMWTERWNAM